MRKRGRYAKSGRAATPPKRSKSKQKPKTKRAPKAAPPLPVEPHPISRELWLAWVVSYAEASPLEHEDTRLTLAETLATARTIVLAFAEIAPIALTDGQSRMLARALKESRDIAKALGLDKIDKTRRKRKPSSAAAPSSTPAAAPKDPNAEDRGPSAVAGGKLGNEGRRSVEPEGARVDLSGDDPPPSRLEDFVLR